MHNLKLYPYKLGSESAKDVSRLLAIKRVKPDGKYVPKIGHTVINWGNSKAPLWLERASRRGVTILNSINSVKIACNKLLALTALEEAGVNTPDFTTDKRVANYWLRDGLTVVERHTLTGNSAEGIRVVNLDDPNMPSELETAPLYTKFIPKSKEFRVHIFRGEVIDYREKKKLKSENRPENFNKYISSHTMGWVFCKKNIKHIDSVKEEAIKAVNALNLDFGAVDVVYYEGTPYVLEVNTAPGIMGTTLANYINTFRSFMGLPDLKFSMNSDGTNVQVQSSLSVDEELNPPVVVHEQRDLIGAANNALDTDLITLTIDKATAKKLKALLAVVE